MFVSIKVCTYSAFGSFLTKIFAASFELRSKWLCGNGAERESEMNRLERELSTIIANCPCDYLQNIFFRDIF